jgi:uncharacterized protein YfaQ (DUF2300 family)
LAAVTGQWSSSMTLRHDPAEERELQRLRQELALDTAEFIRMRESMSSDGVLRELRISVQIARSMIVAWRNFQGLTVH